MWKKLLALEAKKSKYLNSPKDDSVSTTASVKNRRDLRVLRYFSMNNPAKKSTAVVKIIKKIYFGSPQA